MTVSATRVVVAKSLPETVRLVTGAVPPVVAAFAEAGGSRPVRVPVRIKIASAVETSIVATRRSGRASLGEPRDAPEAVHAAEDDHHQDERALRQEGPPVRRAEAVEDLAEAAQLVDRAQAAGHDDDPDGDQRDRREPRRLSHGRIDVGRSPGTRLLEEQQDEQEQTAHPHAGRQEVQPLEQLLGDRRRRRGRVAVRRADPHRERRGGARAPEDAAPPVLRRADDGERVRGEHDDQQPDVRAARSRCGATGSSARPRRAARPRACPPRPRARRRRRSGRRS